MSKGTHAVRIPNESYDRLAELQEAAPRRPDGTKYPMGLYLGMIVDEAHAFVFGAPEPALEEAGDEQG